MVFNLQRVEFVLPHLNLKVEFGYFCDLPVGEDFILILFIVTNFDVDILFKCSEVKYGQFLIFFFISFKMNQLAILKVFVEDVTFFTLVFIKVDCR